jgi:hypothetical protein
MPFFAASEAPPRLESMKFPVFGPKKWRAHKNGALPLVPLGLNRTRKPSADEHLIRRFK